MHELEALAIGFRGPERDLARSSSQHGDERVGKVGLDRRRIAVRELHALVFKYPE